MNRFLRLWAPAAALGLIVGCAGEEGAGTPPPATPPTPAPDITPAPDATPPAPPPVKEAPAANEAPPLTPAEEAKPADAPKPAEEAKPADAPKPAEEAKPADAPLTPPQANAAELNEEEIANIKKLPEADQALALAQAVCPVSDENLGGMDVPVKATIDGRDFFICCENCQKKIKEDPKAVLSKLDKK